MLPAVTSVITCPASHCLAAFASVTLIMSVSFERCTSRLRSRNAPETDQTLSPRTNQCRHVHALLPMSCPISATHANTGIVTSNAHWISRTFFNDDFIGSSPEEHTVSKPYWST